MASNTSGAHFKTLHIPGKPVILPNVWDVPSLEAVVSLNSGSSQPVRVIATASYAIAESLGKRDAELTREENIKRTQELGQHAKKAGLPLTVDIQDGYGEKLEETVRAIVKAGAAGANMEDSVPSKNFAELYPLEEQVARYKRVLEVAKEAGEPDFVLNARSDIFNTKGDDILGEAIKRGKAYLAAGATTAFFWGGSLDVEQLKTLIKELDGRVSVMLGAGTEKLTPKQLGALGLARVSTGPKLYFAGGPDKIKDAAAALYA